jgi:hypothetical protein
MALRADNISEEPGDLVGHMGDDDIGLRIVSGISLCVIIDLKRKMSTQHSSRRQYIRNVMGANDLFICAFGAVAFALWAKLQRKADRRRECID